MTRLFIILWLAATAVSGQDISTNQVRVPEGIRRCGNGRIQAIMKTLCNGSYANIHNHNGFDGSQVQEQTSTKRPIGFVHKCCWGPCSIIELLNYCSEERKVEVLNKDWVSVYSAMLRGHQPPSPPSTPIRIPSSRENLRLLRKAMAPKPIRINRIANNGNGRSRVVRYTDQNGGQEEERAKGDYEVTVLFQRIGEPQVQQPEREVALASRGYASVSEPVPSSVFFPPDTSESSGFEF